ncbi:MAG: S8 family serine peptidase, partial [Salinivirgaceae bacterium]|nr:S8 family serine peptidase [Salinivirgaceae bacterium]
MSAINANAQSKKETDQLIREKVLTKTNVKQLRILEQQLYQQFAEEKSKALELAEEKGWPTQMEKDGRFIELMKVDKDGNPIYYTTYNANAAISTRATTLHNGGLLGLNLEGQGMTAHVWDGGLARSTHQEYDGIGGTDRFSIGDNSTVLNYHSAHVTGTIIASGVKPDAKGMAPQAHAVGYDWNADISEVADAAANGMLLSNHSYGWVASDLPDWVFGAYVADSRDWDEVLYNAPYYLMCVAAGNDGNDNASNGAPLGSDPNYDKLTGHALAKNNLVVANGREIAIDADGEFVSMSINGSSSEGPTDDYRIKPDITGNGTNIYSTYETSNSAYETLTGTSMASPNVCGTLLLLQQYYSEQNAEFMKAATLKGLALHTADDAGPSGPDAAYGWGLMNAKKAAQVIENKFDGTIISEHTLQNGETYTIDVFASGEEELTTSVSWTDVPGIPNEGTANDNTPVLVNDLDIRVTESSNTFYPFRLTSVSTNDNGDNTVDPYEKIIVGSPAAGTRYTITVSHKGTLAAAQDFSLIVTGIDNSSPNSFTATSNDPNQIDLSWNKNSSDDDVLIAWSADGNFGNPANQSNYSVGDAISGGGTVLYKGSQTSFTHSTLTENTPYYYKMWSVLPSGDYSAGIYTNETTIKSEPTEYPTIFAAGTPTGTTIPLTWLDATGSVIPDGYLVKGSYVGFEEIVAPANGALEEDSRLVKNITAGTESKIFDSLIGETNYYFKIYPYTNAGINIKYKTDATPPEASATTDVDPCAGLTLPYAENFDSGDNCWNGVTGNDDWVNTTPTSPSGDHTGGGTCFVTNGNNDYATNSVYNLISPNISLNGFNNCELTFWIYMEAELSSATDYWDGGFIEVWDGTQWTQVTTSLPYDGALHDGNPLGGHDAWAPASIRDWTQVTVDLSAYDENPDFQFRIRFGSDGAAVAPGWAIDDVSVTGDATCIPPENQATDFNVLNSTYNSLDIGWTRGTPNGGDNVLVVAKEAAVAHVDPTKGNSYTADAAFGAGSEIGTDNFVVYDGTGTNVNITNLDNLANYVFSIYEYRISDFCYNLIELSGDAITDAKPVASNHVASFSAGTPTPNEIPLTWTDAAGTVEPDGYLILANTTGTFTDPTNAVPVEDDTNLGDGAGAINIEQGEQGYTFANLDFETQYYFKIFPYTNNGDFIIYKTEGTVPVDNATTLIDPCSIDIISFPYETNFNDIEAPQCWDVLDNEGNGQVWQFGTIDDVAFGTGNYAFLDSDGYGMADDQNSDLVTHTFNFSSYEDVTLSFDHYYKHVGESSATLFYSIDNGTSWTQLQQWTASTNNPEAYSQVLSELDGQSQVKFKFNYIGGFSYYWCIDDLQVDATMLCTPPSDQAVDFNSSAQTTSSIDIEWTRGTPDGGDEVIVLAKKAGAVDADPASGIVYNADAAFGSGSEIGTGNYVVYAGAGNSVTVNNLNGNTNYHFAIYEYDAATPCYLAPGLTGNASTSAKDEPTNHATSLAVGTTTATEMQINWTDATGAILPDGYLLVANTTGAFTDPIDTNSVTDDADLSDGSAVMNVAQGIESYTFTGLEYSTQYFFKLYPYSNSETLINFKTDGTVPETNGTTSADPCVVDLSATDYIEDFESVITPALPSCTSMENANSDGYKWGSSSDYPNSGLNHLSIQYNENAAMNDWFFSQPLELKAGHEYELSFWYRARSASYPEKLKVKLGTANSSSAMTLDQLFDNNNIVNETYTEGQQTFSVAADGVYYLGWQGYSDVDMWFLYVDDISVTDLGSATNSAPVVENPISDMTETEGFVSTTIDIASVFTDADDDELAFSTSSDATNVATASLDGTTLTITEAGTGTANITVTANDGNGGSVSDVFEFNVNAAANNAPVVENPISDMTETEGFVSTTIDIASVFADADADELTFSTSSDANSVATASLVGTTLTITEAGTGT